MRPDLAAAVAAARSAEFTARRALPPPPQGARRSARGDTPERLRLCYLVPRTDVGGGARVLFEHANRLHDRGHEVTVLSHFTPPAWFGLRARFQQVPFGVELAETVPACDVIVAGYWDQVLAARTLGVAPVVHFEQGDFHLFEDIDQETREVVARNVEAADATIIVSGTVAAVLRDRYGVAATVIANAVDPTVFHPAVGGDRQQRPYLLFVGWDGTIFKGMAEMRQVWQAVAGHGDGVELVWVTPRPPRDPLGRVVVSPDQATLGALYRGAAAYVCCSHYETFPLPPLEAMASGTPVVTTRNTGVLEYARDGENALLADIHDVDGLAARVRRVLDEPDLAARLRDGGLKTAAGYSWDTIITRVEETYRGVCAAWSPTTGDDWRFDLGGLRFVDAGAEQRLRQRAAASASDAIAVPVTFPAFEGHRAVRWRIVGRRAGSDPDGGVVGRAYLPVHADDLPDDLPYAAALREFAAGRFDRALAGFLDAYRRGKSGDRPSASRWIVLTLLELGNDEQAASVVAGGVEAFPGHSDFHYLHAMTSMLTGRPIDGAAYVAVIDALGPATHYDEWFDEPGTLIRERLLAPAR
ncbi:glycosyltransferase family 4 protein [Dactylosporangium sp. NBC_01737]|uniref:glycosyltransferase family 4 protein n=1 Tax=Dactylosporangium sp. NBC_01737 TaxID=2975959 RepID=UPI002E1152C3|nr:glycosyltransferase family 4 protein [Dactylosporangium sp. NBC_01737]